MNQLPKTINKFVQNVECCYNPIINILWFCLAEKGKWKNKRTDSAKTKCYFVISKLYIVRFVGSNPTPGNFSWDGRVVKA